MKIHITAVIDTPMTKEEHEQILLDTGVPEGDFIKGIYSDIRKALIDGYCSENESAWVKNIQVNF